jgi:SnoaL-like protein
MDENIEASSQLTVMEGGYRGHEGVRRWWGDLTGAFPDWKIEIVDVRDLGDVTVAALLASGHGAGSDAPAQTSVWQVGRWRAGKAVWWASFQVESEALEAVGLSE